MKVLHQTDQTGPIREILIIIVMFQIREQTDQFTAIEITKIMSKMEVIQDPAGI